MARTCWGHSACSFFYCFVFHVINAKTLRRSDGRKDWQFDRHFYMRVIVILIPTNLVTSSLLSLCFSFGRKQKLRIGFLVSWWSGNKKYYFFLFLASSVLFQRHNEFNRLIINFIISTKRTWLSTKVRPTNLIYKVTDLDIFVKSPQKLRDSVKNLEILADYFFGISKFKEHFA